MQYFSDKRRLPVPKDIAKPLKIPNPVGRGLPAWTIPDAYPYVRGVTREVLTFPDPIYKIGGRTFESYCTQLYLPTYTMITISFSTLITSAKTLNSIRSFVYGEGLITSVSAISGDTHLKSALSVLKNLSFSNDPKARLQSCITHLESAHNFYVNIYEDAPILFSLAPIKSIKYDLSCVQAYIAWDKDLWVCSLLVLAYAALGDPGMVGYWLFNCYRVEANMWCETRTNHSERLSIKIGRLIRGQEAESHNRIFNKTDIADCWLSTSDIQLFEDTLSTSMSSPLDIHVLKARRQYYGE